jgi:Concanavalin A-like lectin/glucanases superfamily
MNRVKHMNLSRIGTWIVLAASIALSACGGGAATTQNPAPPGGPPPTYTGPAAATADIQAFKIAFWENVRPQNRCGQCHNATSPGQMPNFARSDDVNLAYQQANTVVNLSQPSLSRIVAKVRGGHNCWLTNNDACGDTIESWIRNWAGATASGGTQITLTAPVIKDVGTSKNFPTDPAAFQTTVWPLLTQYCARCHTADSATKQQPYFASSDVNEAYAAARPKMNLDDPSQSRFVLRLRNEFHNCWNGDCVTASATMEAAIQAFANQIPLTAVDPALVISKALGLFDGTVASGGNRHDTNVIAKYEFKTGKGTTAFDTSGIEPAANMTLSGDATWVGGWGLKFGPGGKAQAATATSKKIHDLVLATGEYSVEAWVAPANVAQTDAYMVSYSAGTMARNFTMGQTKYNYDFMQRSSSSDANGAPALSTADAARRLQASLQHVVLTYDPVNGRKIYVNGEYTGDVDSAQGGSLSDWDDTFALVLGNEVSGNRSWAGVIKLVAIHNRALTIDQIKQNFAAGVGEKYFLLFNVESVVNVPKAYVVFEVSQYDTYAYLFSKPTFISLDSAAAPNNIPVKGMRIGINGLEAKVGQAYSTLDTMITASNYGPMGQSLSSIGTIIGLEKGSQNDLFFLTFERLGSQTHVVTEPTPIAAVPVDRAPVPDIGVRTFDEINETMSSITGVPKTNAKVLATFNTVKQQLPTVGDLQSFLASHQVGVAQIGIQYCSELVNDATRRAQIWPSVDFNSGSQFTTQAGIDAVVNPLVDRVLGTGLASQPDAASVRTELNSMVGKLNTCGAGCTAARVQSITKATCAAALGSAAMLVK